MHTTLVILVLCGIALSLAVPYGDESYSNDGKKIKYRFQYAASFACGSNDGSDASLVDGLYATTVQIHNPMEKGTANLRKKVALSFPAAASGKNAAANAKNPGQISKFLTDTLGADGAMQIDCGEIMGNTFFGQSKSGASAFGKNTYAQGYLVIESDVSLDVDRITTAGNPVEYTVVDAPETTQSTISYVQPPTPAPTPAPHNKGTGQASRSNYADDKKAPPKKQPAPPAPIPVKNTSIVAAQTHQETKPQVSSVDASEVKERQLKK